MKIPVFRPLRAWRCGNRLEMSDAGCGNEEREDADSVFGPKPKGLKKIGPNLDRDHSGPFCGTAGLGLVRSTDIRSVFVLPYLLPLQR